ncbi:SDR family NAD(P)-dependent oxidoreductase [Pseudarthrobacter niigatensis]|uniref:NAD(P)-dependent dehydrogenase (Short-subunit alcohol dehydrogenase family) n=1 Tax=Pseudarthrobacter niigatensis TaxID=369935 RepID=A0AAJ1SUM9_9MICC|nr:SDR family oxidoreductase [Pseudarthrobacter niigatensis]MDQ0144663.1 NAD(P)-dependent dehydrogenase (short-subunit alcohol dehydrogenase family) [Pseudarthrobacter niigatensis]MDQ0265309.1 NAD(P)-dependent dehydrogenase (short-subunit alcohol dehydrogenase family) [Pseudarthrobacter niigatensis]
MENLSQLQVAVVTGAGRGIGAAIAHRLGKDGFHVIVADVDRATAGNVAAEIKEAGGSAESVCLDVADKAEVQDWAQEVAERLGRLDVVVNNAMWIRYGPLVEMTEEDIDRMLGVGLKGVIWMIQAAAPLMAARGSGCIVNVSSPAAVRATRDAGIYAAVKGAVSSLTWQMSSELGRQGIRVNAVVPGAVPTEGARALVDEEGYELRRAKTPLGRLGAPDDLASAVSFLASNDASFINGHLLTVDGGLTVS